MTVAAADAKAGPYTGNDVATTFSFAFKIFAATDIRVVETLISSGAETELVLNGANGYTVVKNNDQDNNPGGTITYRQANANAPLPATKKLTIVGNFAYSQPTDLPNGGPFFANVVENALDRLTMLVKQLREGFNRSLRLSVSDPAGSATEIPPISVRANNLLGFDANGNPVAVAPIAQSATALQALLATTAGAGMIGNNPAGDIASVTVQGALNELDAEKAAYATLIAATGAGLSGFDFAQNYVANTVGWGIRTGGNSFNVWRLIPPSEWPAIADYTSTYDVTSILTTAIATYKDVFLPAGKYRLNPATGVLFVLGANIHGAGHVHTVCVADATGGTMAQLAAHGQGSIFKRAFTLGVPNARMDYVRMADMAVVMNHPTGAVTTTDIQIAIDLRHVGRFKLERVWAGNIPPIGGPFAKADPGAYGSQGFGIVVGNIDSGNVAYCGGEVGEISNCFVYSAFKNIVIDDATLSPLSGAHAITISGCDVQGGHSLIAQEQQYTTGCLFIGNTVQNVVRQPGNASATYVYRIAGYENDLLPGYIEAGVTDYLLRFDSASLNNRVRMGHYSATTIGIQDFSDTGRRNTVWCNVNSGAIPGGVDSKGIPIVLYDRSYSTMSVIAHWNGSAVVQDGGFGLTMTRPTAAGDYLFTFAKAVLDAKAYTIKVVADTNASGHGGTYAIISSTTTNVRIQFYAQNGATTTAIDPRFVFVEVQQVGGA